MDERNLVPLIFETYAAELTERVVRLASRLVLEVACGTGVTWAMPVGLDDAVTITATDLNQSMIDHPSASAQR